MDFMLITEQIAIEVKMTRESLDAKKVQEQLIIDIAYYTKHPKCNQLVCFVYDPQTLITNKHAIINDLESLATDSFSVRVFINP